MRPLGVIGHLSRDAVANTPTRIGGGVWHAGRALRALGRDALLLGRCGEADAGQFRRRLTTLGLPVTLIAAGGTTTGFSFSYDADGTRTMQVDSIGEPWVPEDVPATLLRRVEWVHAAPLLQGELDLATLEQLAHGGRRLLLDGQGLVRVRRIGPLELDGEIDRALLAHVSILKLAEEEARAIVGDGDLEELRGLGVPEVVVTFGLAGSLVLDRGVAERVRARPVQADPTGAGDAFAVAYLDARAAGHAPVSAARRATALVAALLTEAQL